MTNPRENQKPVNLAGQQFLPIKSIEVQEFHPLENGEGPATQVHLRIKIEGMEDTPIVVRFHSPKAIDELIVALITHRQRVFGRP